MSDSAVARPFAAAIPVHLVLLLAATLSSVAWQGFDFPVDNNAFHVPIVLDYAGSMEGPADAFHRFLDRYVSALWPLLSLLATDANIYALFLGLHVAVRFATAVLMWRLAVLFGGATTLSAVFVCFILFFDTFVGRSPLGRSEILVGYLTHSQVVVPVVLGAWWCLFDRRFLAAGALLGLAFNVNAFAAIWGAVAAGAVMVVECRDEGFRRLVKKVAGAGGLFLLCAAPTALWILRALGDVGPYPPFSYGEYLREYYGYHYFVDLQWESAAAFALAIAVGFALLQTAGPSWPRERRRRLVAVFAAYGGIIGFGAVAPYLIDHRLVFVLHPLRMDAYVVFLLGVIALAWCFHAFREGGDGERAYAAIALFSLVNGNLVLLLAACLLARGGLARGLGAWLGGGALAAMAGVHAIFGAATRIGFREGPIEIVFLLQAVVVTYFLLKAPDRFRDAAPLMAAVFLGILPEAANIPSLTLVLGVNAALFLRLVPGRFEAAFSVGAAGLLGIVLAREMPLHWLALWAAAFLVPVLAAASPAVAARLLVPPSTPQSLALVALLASLLLWGPLQMAARGGLSYDPAATRAYADVQRWARRNTPPGTMFLPVDMNGFATLSRRPVWADWQAGGMVMWAPEAYATWSRRWKRLKEIRSIADAAKIAAADGIPYIVFDKAAFRPAGVPPDCLAYENARFWIMTACWPEQQPRQSPD